MLHFTEFAKASSIYTDHNITKIITFLSLDTMADCNMYKALSQKYPDLDTKFAEAISNKTLKPGDYIRVQVASGHTIYFLIIRAVEKFQPYIFDILKAIGRATATIKRETTENTTSSVLFAMPTGDDLKLSDAIFIPAICGQLNDSKLDVYILTNGDHEQYIEKIENNIIYYKRDSWKSDWMLSLDDILFIEIISRLLILCHDFKISKANLIRCYYVCHQAGMYPKFEWYKTEFGQFFRMFLPKSNSLINHGLLTNVHHYSNVEPKKFSCILGPMVSHIKYLAFTQLALHEERITKIANDIRQDYFEQLKLRREDPDRQSYQKSSPANHDQNQNMFAL